LFIGILLPSVVSAQAELTFVATRDTIAHNVRTSATVVLRAGDPITTNAAVSFGQLNVAGDMHLTIIFGEPDNQYMVLANYRRYMAKHRILLPHHIAPSTHH